MSLRKAKLIVLTLLVVLVGGSLLVQADEVITLTVLNYFDATSPGAERVRTEIWQEFAKRNPDIRIEREDLYLEPFHQKTEAYVAAGELPDVLLIWPGGRSATVHTQKLVKDLGPFVEPIRDEFMSAALEPQMGGYLAMIASGVTVSHVFYVNTALLDELGMEIPQTYADLVAMVEPLKAQGLDVVLMGAQDDWVVQSTLFSMIVGRLVGDEYMDKIIAGEAKFTDDVFVDALRFYKSMYDDGVLSRRNLQTSYGEVNGLFAQGRAPFLIDGDWKVQDLITDPETGLALMSPEEQENVLMTVFPAIDGEVISGSSSVVQSTGFAMNAAIPAGSAKEEAAWRLIQWLTSPEVQKVNLEIGERVSRVGITSDKLEPILQERARFYGESNPGTYVLDNVLVSQVYNPLNIGLQEIGLGFATPEEVAEKIQKAFDAWFESQ